MSDQDFFFDEEEEEAKPAKSSSKPAAKPAGKAPARATAAKPAPAPRETTGGSFFEQSVTMTIAALMTVIGLLVGVIIGFVAAPKGTASTTDTGAAATGTTTGQPRALTEDEMNAGTLPQGHPDISQMGGTVPTSSAEPTSGN